jgi:glycosyltransferase involved in cell wall biosynthesis
MRILVSTPTFLPVVGGAELGIHELYDRIGRRHEVTILTPNPKREIAEDYGADDYVGKNYTVHRLASGIDRCLPGTFSHKLKQGSPLYMVEMAQLIHRLRPDLINFHFIKPQGAALMLAKHLYNIPIALSLVGRSDVLRLLSGPKRLYAERVIQHADVALPNSTYYLGDWQGDVRVRVIPYGVDTDEFSEKKRSSSLRHDLGLTDEHFLLFSIQRLAPIKRVDLLVRMMSNVVQGDRRVALVIGGKGEEEAQLRRLVSEHGLGDNVKFAGYIGSDRLPEYFASADAFVFHSLIETFGIVFVQAMASGLPIIAANTSCVPDVLTSENGTLVTPFDTRAFADAVLALAGNQMEARAIGKHNRCLAVEKFDWNSIAEQYEEVFHEMVHNPGRPETIAMAS